MWKFDKQRDKIISQILSNTEIPQFIALKVKYSDQRGHKVYYTIPNYQYKSKYGLIT